QRFLYRYLIFVGVVSAFFLVFFANFWAAARYLAATDGQETKKSRIKPLHAFLRGSLSAYAFLSVALAVPIALPLYSRWEDTLLFLFSEKSGVVGSVFGKDITYYLFDFPLYVTIQSRLLLGFAVVGIVVGALYWVKRREAGHWTRLPLFPRIHLTVLAALLVGLQAWNFVLHHHALLMVDSHQPLFFGPGYVEMMVRLPLLWAAFFLVLATGLSLLVTIHTQKGVRVLAGFAALLPLVLGAGYSDFLTDWVQKYNVSPNEIAKEKPYIANSIRATLQAFGLDRVEHREYSLSDKPTPEGGDQERSLRNVPVWDREYLMDYYFQIQGIRPYYKFADVDVDRYNVGNASQQVYLAAREMDLSRLPAYARSWINVHLRYTHGQGVVMTPAAQSGEEGMVWFIRDIPPGSDFGFSIENPDIYYGTEPYPWIMAPNDTGELDRPGQGEDLLASYEGKGGVLLSGFWKKLLMSMYLGDRNLLFTTKANEKSRVLFRRNIVERIRHLTPFLVLDQDPYIVVTNDRLHWVQDAYTTSDRYPNAEGFPGSYNYIRNSVKIVVDAYDGTVSYYIADPEDPIIRAYDRIYPGLFLTLDKMPQELARHLRYPKDLFAAQMEKYAKYHQTNPEIFYQQQDLWEFAKTYYKKGEQARPMQPYYLTVDLIREDRQEFLLISPMSPFRRENLRSLAIGRCDGENRGRILIYEFPQGQQVFGPSQVSTVIDQDPDIAQQFTLWDQAGSEVRRGRMIILPINHSIIYFQPVYLRSVTASRFPELKRVIASDGTIAVMDVSVEKALEKMEERLRVRNSQSEKRFPIQPNS
ncbi:MAG: UPF0182 family protein, partial [Pseudomonadota bacterium]